MDLAGLSPLSPSSRAYIYCKERAITLIFLNNFYWSVRERELAKMAAARAIRSNSAELQV